MPKSKSLVKKYQKKTRGKRKHRRSTRRRTKHRRSTRRRTNHRCKKQENYSHSGGYDEFIRQRVAERARLVDQMNHKDGINNSSINDETLTITFKYNSIADPDLHNWTADTEYNIKIEFGFINSERFIMQRVSVKNVDGQTPRAMVQEVVSDNIRRLLGPNLRHTLENHMINSPNSDYGTPTVVPSTVVPSTHTHSQPHTNVNLMP